MNYRQAPKNLWSDCLHIAALILSIQTCWSGFSQPFIYTKAKYWHVKSDGVSSHFPV